jgi:hypothetical protein
MKVKCAVEKEFNFYCLFVESLLLLRRMAGLSVAQLSADSHVSTRTYAKFSKKTPIKIECCFRLVAGSCKGATKEEFLSFCKELGTQIYDSFSDC